MFSPITIFYFSTLLLFQGQQSEARGPVCLQCDQVAQPSDCRNVKRCGEQELCIMRKYVTNGGHTWFDVGCSSSQRCSPITSILGKRDDDIGAMSTLTSTFRRNAELNITSTYVRSAGTTIVCEKCCFGDICNAGSLCGTVGFLHEMVCFDCSSTNEDGCTSIALCGQEEKCFIDRVNNSSTSNSVWNTGCRHKTVCQQLQSNPGSDCLSSCCSSDLCNIKCTSNNTDAMCADMTPTCTNKTFQSFVCSETKLQTVCPRSCGLCHCNPNPCKHGTCKSSRQGYTCSCDAGYMGPICDRVINPMNPCMSGPCLHGTCHKSHKGYKCTCDIGFTGSTCDTVISAPPGTLWNWADCGGDSPTRSIFFSHLDIFPKPIQIPGNITTAYDITINRRIEKNSNFSVGLTIDKRMPNYSWYSVPCNKYCGGSCLYENLCEKFEACCSEPNCSQAVFHSGLKCPLCPIDPVHYAMNYHGIGKRSWVESLTSFFEAFVKGISLYSTILAWLKLFSGRIEVFNETNVTSAWDFLWNGDFRIQADFIERDELIGCFGTELSIRG